MKIAIYGDIHGEVVRMKDMIVKDTYAERHIQIGDYGYGWLSPYLETAMDEFENFGFIRGNHDDPARCRKSPKYMGDFGTEVLADGTKMMWVSGAWSIDHARRTPGKSWWEDEQLSDDQLMEVINLYADFKPDVMLTHDAPAVVSNAMFLVPGLGLGGVANSKQCYNRTNVSFDVMLNLHSPKKWFYGHWHHTVQQEIRKCGFCCVGQNDSVYLDTANMNVW